VGPDRGLGRGAEAEQATVATLLADPDRPDPEVLERALRALGGGGLLIFPTDTLYALGGLFARPGVAEAVRTAKGRREGHLLPLIARDRSQVEGLCSRFPEAAARLAEAFWPGPLTLVLPARGDVGAEGDTVAVRVPARALARELCRDGALISTSANLTGAPPPLTCREAVEAVGRAAALALDGGPGTPAPSTIVDVSGPLPRLVRGGAVSWDEVENVLRTGGS
jgi:tRNA threonylcarbamoyl adenosine modification protein (Sua5/YciO/YrdC/YwlC family)